MVEDIGKIISNGFETYTRNLNLGIPFFLNIFITGMLAVIVLGFGFFSIFGQSLSSLENVTSPEALLSILYPIVKQHIIEIGVLILLYFLVSVFLQSFFMAGAIGMAQKATETGTSELSTMIDAGKKNVSNLYLAEVLVGLLYMAGVVFLVPGALKADIKPLSDANVLLIFGGIFLWLVYIMILSIMLVAFSYALVIENLAPVDGITAGFNFFNKNKSDVFMLWLITGIIIVTFTIIGDVIGTIPVIKSIWSFISMFISAFVFAPLTTLWWTRLYMDRTNKKLYFNELLAHPNDLAKLKASQ
ncbi:MAG: hypothetical protein PHU34_11795 [Candidatus Methanoperedens sp.]|nr:hypothetical protein [Candidatus Methanoperedens sp.]